MSDYVMSPVGNVYRAEKLNPETADTFRPVVVIDPENREQVERLSKAMHESDHIAPWHDLHHETREAMENAMQAALRSLIAPPKPPEPTGLGAVVEDADGEKWVRTHHDLDAHWRSADFGGVYLPFDRIDVVRVLSEGVQP